MRAHILPRGVHYIKVSGGRVERVAVNFSDGSKNFSAMVYEPQVIEHLFGLTEENKEKIKELFPEGEHHIKPLTEQGIVSAMFNNCELKEAVMIIRPKHHEQGDE